MNEIIISLDIIWSKKNYDTIIFKNGTIVISENQITVIGEITPSESRTFSTAYPANIDLYLFLQLIFLFHSSCDISNIVSRFDNLSIN